MDNGGALDMSTAGGQVAASVLTGPAVAQLYGLFCPPMSELRSPEFHEHYGAEHLAAVRHGYAAATAVVIPIGIASSLLVGSWLPLVSTALVAAGMIAAYEHAMSHPATGAGPGWGAA